MKKITFLLILCLASYQLMQAQTFFSDDFSDLDISDWTTYDVDGDTYTWGVGDWSSQGPGIAEFNHVLVSRSWIGGGVGGLNPDNYVVSQAIDLTSASAIGLQLRYAYGTVQAAPYQSEKYSVYITTSNTLASIQAATPIHTETLVNPGSRETKTIDMSAYAGQTVYLTFRHYDTFDMNTMIIDDIVVLSVTEERDAIAEAVNLNRYSLVSQDNQLSVDITNNGYATITSLEINWNDGTTDHISTIPTDIAPGATVTVNHPMMVNYAQAEEKDISITVSQVNGAADNNPDDNTLSSKFNTLSQAGTKAVLMEEATGTWCGWCPRGAVGLDYITSTYPETVVGVAVHNSDPMAVTEYDNGIGTFISGYPSGVVDRSFVSDPSSTALQTAYDQVSDQIVPVNLSASASLDGANITIEANANFFTTFSNANYRLGVIITENNVTGTSSGYNQINYYAGGANGPMGGYESLPASVPASQMVYDHVGRALLGGYTGQVGSVPTSINDGDTASYTFNYTIPTTSAQEEMKIVVVLIDGTNGTVVSANETSVTNALSVSEFSNLTGVKIYPNPAKEILNIAFEIGTGKYNVVVTDMLGRTVINKSYNNIFGNSSLELPVSQLSEGHYILNVNDGKASYNTKFIIN